MTWLFTLWRCWEKVVGYCGMWLILDEAHITNVAVHLINAG